MGGEGGWVGLGFEIFILVGLEAGVGKDSWSTAHACLLRSSKTFIQQVIFFPFNYSWG